MTSSQPYQLQWRASSYSGGNQNCVEVAESAENIGLRDSKNPGFGHLTFADAHWAAFLHAVKADELGT